MNHVVSRPQQTRTAAVSTAEEPVTGLAGPVRWLLGARFVSSLKSTLVAIAFEDKLDAREWMTAREIPCGRPDQERFWFDYIADSGDGGKATFSIACLCYSDLLLEGTPIPGTRVRFGDSRQAEGERRLERGEFLFVGGDTAYHVADYDTLARRFQNPFTAAAARCGVREGERRKLFGIPGNHDYYDALHGSICNSGRLRIRMRTTIGATRVHGFVCRVSSERKPRAMSR